MARKKVPDSVAQKSHRLLMRWYKLALNGSVRVSWEPDILMHCRRIAKGGRK